MLTTQGLRRVAGAWPVGAARAARLRPQCARHHARRKGNGAAGCASAWAAAPAHTGAHPKPKPPWLPPHVFSLNSLMVSTSSADSSDRSGSGVCSGGGWVVKRWSRDGRAHRDRGRPRLRQQPRTDVSRPAPTLQACWGCMGHPASPPLPAQLSLLSLLSPTLFSMLAGMASTAAAAGAGAPPPKSPAGPLKAAAGRGKAAAASSANAAAPESSRLRRAARRVLPAAAAAAAADGPAAAACMLSVAVEHCCCARAAARNWRRCSAGKKAGSPLLPAPRPAVASTRSVRREAAVTGRGARRSRLSDTIAARCMVVYMPLREPGAGWRASSSCERRCGRFR